MEKNKNKKYKRNKALNNALFNIVYCYYSMCFSREYRAKRTYKKYFGKGFDRNKPKTFSEVMSVQMCSREYEALAPFTDKYLVREYVEKTIGSEYLIPLLGVYNTPSDIRWQNIPENSIIKTNHGSRFNLIYKKNKKVMVYKLILFLWLHIDYSKFAGERQYRKIERKIIIEKNIAEKSAIEEYSCFIFDGKTEFVCIKTDLGRYYESDRDGGQLPFSFHENVVTLENKPERYDEIICLAEKLAAPFGFVRVDLICTVDRIFFGELTFSPMSGLYRFDPPNYSYYWGNRLLNTKIYTEL